MLTIIALFVLVGCAWADGQDPSLKCSAVLDLIYRINNTIMITGVTVTLLIIFINLAIVHHVIEIEKRLAWVDNAMNAVDEEEPTITDKAFSNKQD